MLTARLHSSCIPPVICACLHACTSSPYLACTPPVMHTCPLPHYLRTEWHTPVKMLPSASWAVKVNHNREQKRERETSPTPRPLSSSWIHTEGNTFAQWLFCPVCLCKWEIEMTGSVVEFPHWDRFFLLSSIQAQLSWANTICSHSSNSIMEDGFTTGPTCYQHQSQHSLLQSLFNISMANTELFLCPSGCSECQKPSIF